MVKGTPSQGKKSKGKLHFPCRRCGNASYHKKKSVCSSCGFGKTSKLRRFNWLIKCFKKKTKIRN